MNMRNAAYWTCQVLGWGTWTALGIAMAIRQVGWRPSIVIGYVLFFLYSILLTHFLRREIRRRHWLALPAGRMVPRLLAASLLTAAVQTALVIGVQVGIEGKRTFNSLSAVTGLAFGLMWAAILWTILYVAITAMRRDREARRNTLQLQLALREAELRALGAQINPHFLFNCLNTIRGMIVEDATQAQDMTTRLANILRYNLQHDRTHTVPLAREIEVVSDYLAIEAIRFEDRLRVEFSIDPAAAQVPVPSMLLQTLVENALKHGLANLPEGGELVIRAAIRQDALVIEVENTGRLTQPRPGATQVGLKNARDRLRLLYGDHASLNLANRDGGRVSATVLIPKTA
jgi:two-component system sensor histidine kinase AlgZ